MFTRATTYDIINRTYHGGAILFYFFYFLFFTLNVLLSFFLLKLTNEFTHKERT